MQTSHRQISSNEAPHSVRSNNRRYIAVERVSPSPVQTATYAAKHAGHFGSNAQAAPEETHPASSRPRRAVVGDSEFIFITAIHALSPAFYS